MTSNPIPSEPQPREFILPALHTASVDALRTEFVFKLANRRVAARFLVVPEQLLLEHIPQRIGHSRALDDAVICICSARPPRETSLDTVNVPMTTGSPYLTALKSLQSSLDDAKLAVSSETLAAATLLQMYEHSVDQPERAWVVHSDGVIKMLEFRGPSRIRNELERSVLQAQVGNIFTKAVRNRAECFLAQPRWKTFLQDYPTADPAFRELSATLNIGVHLPGLICRYERLLSSTDSDQIEGHEKKSDYLSRSAQDETSCQPHRLAIDLYEACWQLESWYIRFESSCNKSDERAPRRNALPPLQPALRLSVNIFLVLTNYMLVATLSKVDSAPNASDDEQTTTPLLDLVAISEQCETLASTAKSHARTLQATDASAFANTATLHKMMLARVLEKPQSSDSKADCLRFVLEELYSNLNNK